MVRTRTNEATVVGVLAALATFCALEARGGQPYSVVGQSTAKTAATGRRPLAERIKAANRPIRLTPEADLAPDEGLIRELTEGDGTERRPWPLTPPVVEFVDTDAPPSSGIGGAGEADESVDAASNEPAVMPPPVAEALAANPTTAGDEGSVGEAAAIDAVAGEAAAATPADVGSAERPADAAAVRAMPQRVAPSGAPRRSVSRVTPQRREALLDRLRTALAGMPRPFGLVPTPEPRAGTRAVRPQATRRPAPAPSAVVPPEEGPTVAEAEVAAAETPAVPDQSPAATDSLVDGGTGADVPAVDAQAAFDPQAVDASGLVETETPDGGETPGLIDVAPADEVAMAEPAETAAGTESDPTETSAPADDAVAEVVDAGAAAEVVAEAKVDADRGAAVAVPTATATAPRKATRGTAPRSRAPASIVQRPRPFGRLQATLDSLPRPLGILPAPRPQMQASAAPRRASTPSPRAIARAPQQPPANAGLATVDQAVPGEDATAADPATGTAEPSADSQTGSEATSSLAGTEIQEGVAAADAAPETLSVDDSVAEGAMPEAAACIEITVEGPDGDIVRGEQILLRLTVRNTGDAPAHALTPMFHFGAGVEPHGVTGRAGTLTEKGSVVVEALPELAPGESIEFDVVATCHEVGTVPFQGVVWCGEGEEAEQVPVDGELRVVPGRIATAPEGRVRR